MKNIKKIIAAVSAFAVASVFAVSAPETDLSIDTVSAISDDDINDDWLHAEGSKLYDMDGNQVWLTGVNWFGFNCTENFPHGLWSADINELLQSVADHGINCIRFPVSTELLMSWQNGDPLMPVGLNPSNDVYYSFNPDFCNPDGSSMDSMGIFDVIMQKMKEYGIKAIIDVHSPASHNSGHNYNLWYYCDSAADADNMAVTADGTKVTTDMWIDSITWLADKYKNDDTIIAYDLKNEPHGKRGYSGTSCPEDIAKWDDSTDENNWAYAATLCGKSILNVNPNALILIEGVEQYPKTDKGYTYDTADIWQASASVSPWNGGWWGGNLRGVKDYPIDFGSETLNSQIVYSPHDYGPGVYEQTWFDKDFTTQTLLDDYWYDTWAYINDQDIAPLLIGEWGGFMDGGKNEQWLTLLRDYMIDNHINHTFWCLNPNSGDTGGLLDSSFQVWDDEKYALFEPSLWQTDEGVYIGLDHKTALGQNGMSLSEYYASGEASNLDGYEQKGQGISGNKPDTTETSTDTSATTTTTTTTATTTSETVTDSTESVTSDNTSGLAGDTNCDGKISAIDLIVLKNHILGSKEITDTQSLANADMNGDGNISVLDIIKLKSAMLS